VRTNTSELSDDKARLAILKAAREKSVNWFAARIADDGEPAGADIANAWWRAPWALAVAGAPDIAAAMLGWVERNALTDDGDLKPGRFGGGQLHSPVYFLSPLAIAANLLARYDLADLIMERMKAYWNAETGGIYEITDYHTDPVEEILKTCQFGISSLVTGNDDVSEKIFTWLQRIYCLQPSLPGKLYPALRNGVLITKYEERDAFMRCVDFSASRQAYFFSGIAAAFLAGYYQRTGNKAALQLAEAYLVLNEKGTDQQFEDQSSIQICKYGWGVAATYTASPTPERRVWVRKMADWFVGRQEEDGSWAPSSFSCPRPGALDYYWKTAEHLMEMSYIEIALRQ